VVSGSVVSVSRERRVSPPCKRDRMFIIWQPPKGENDDYDSENSWISGWLPSRRRKQKGRRRKKDERPTQRHIVTGDISQERTWHRKRLPLQHAERGEYFHTNPPARALDLNFNTYPQWPGEITGDCVTLTTKFDVGLPMSWSCCCSTLSLRLLSISYGNEGFGRVVSSLGVEGRNYGGVGEI